jgi:hypothetical protein
MNPIVGAARTLGPESDCAGNDFTMRGSTFSGWQTALCSALHGALSLPNIETVAAYEPLLFSRPAQPG